MSEASSTAPAPTVCVVDDDCSVRVALERLFRGAGWTVKGFGSAEEFLKHDQLDCACLVADVHLGKMTGLELQAALGARGDAPAMILTSGLAEDEMEMEARRLGAIAFFPKPFDAGALLDVVSRALAQTAP
ncbi:MAG TPA: response regulator [Gemmatimonadaceae bacterium]|nr:response regulator [Gemmatimonadaceae bacterium]